MQGEMKMAGKLGVKKVTPPGPGLRWHLRNRLRWAWVQGWIGWHMARLLTVLTGVPALCGSLHVRLIRADGSMVNYGVVCRRVVTTAFVNFVVDQLQTETSVFGDFKYHDSGVGTTDPAITDTAIETTDGESRVAGSQTESAANVYRSVGTISYTTTKAITEHGLFNDATAGTLMDRSEFAVVNVVNGESIQFTYDFTVTSGG